MANTFQTLLNDDTMLARAFVEQFRREMRKSLEAAIAPAIDEAVEEAAKSLKAVLQRNYDTRKDEMMFLLQVNHGEQKPL